MKKYFQYSLLLLLFWACDDAKEQEPKMLSGKWKQSQMIVKGQLMADESNPINNVTYQFYPDGKFSLLLTAGKFDGTYEFVEDSMIAIHAGPSNESYLIQKMGEKELELIDASKGTLLKFRLIE